MKVTLGESHWEVSRRYSEIRELLNLKLREKSNIIIDGFPARTLLNQFDDHFVLQRQSALSVWFSKLCRFPGIENNPIVLQFLDPMFMPSVETLDPRATYVGSLFCTHSKGAKCRPCYLVLNSSYLYVYKSAEATSPEFIFDLLESQIEKPYEEKLTITDNKNNWISLKSSGNTDKYQEWCQELTQVRVKMDPMNKAYMDMVKFRKTSTIDNYEMKLLVSKELRDLLPSSKTDKIYPKMSPSKKKFDKKKEPVVINDLPDSPNNIIYNPDGSIKAATKEKLIEKLCDHNFNINLVEKLDSFTPKKMHKRTKLYGTFNFDTAGAFFYFPDFHVIPKKAGNNSDKEESKRHSEKRRGRDKFPGDGNEKYNMWKRKNRHTEKPISRSEKILPKPPIEESGDNKPIIEGPTVGNGVPSNSIVRLTTPECIENEETYEQNNFIVAFMYIFNSFMSPADLLDALTQRFMNIPRISSGEHEKKGEDVTPHESEPGRVRIINVLCTWLQVHFYDFIEDTQLEATLTKFIEQNISEEGSVETTLLTELIDSKLHPKPPEPDLTKAPPLILPPVCLLGHFDLQDLDPIEIARQLTLMHYDQFKKIPLKEFFSQGWSKKDARQRVPFLFDFMKEFNKRSSWVATYCTMPHTPEKRSRIMGKFIKVALTCVKELQNYHTAMAIMAGLNNASVTRLKQSWALVNNKDKENFDSLDEFLSPKNNWSAYRNILKNSNPPCLPYLGMFLADLTFLEDGNPDIVGINLINFEKWYRESSIFRNIQMFQSSLYNLHPIGKIQKYLKHMTIIKNGKELYTLSLQQEGRT